MGIWGLVSGSHILERVRQTLPASHTTIPGGHSNSEPGREIMIDVFCNFQNFLFDRVPLSQKPGTRKLNKEGCCLLGSPRRTSVNVFQQHEFGNAPVAPLDFV